VEDSREGERVRKGARETRVGREEGPLARVESEQEKTVGHGGFGGRKGKVARARALK
jgi:hypothetical protein